MACPQQIRRARGRRMKAMSSLAELTDRVAAGERLSRDQAFALYTQAPTHVLGRLADRVRARKHPARVVTYIIDRNVNYTNVCVARCNFCAFYRPVGSGDGYVLSFEEIFRKVEETIAVGGGQFLLQGGHNPDIPLRWYEDLFRAVKARYPSFRLHALSPPEVVHISRLSGLTPPQVIRRLIDAGLDSIPGGGAEILVDRVRKLLHCYGKASADEWLGVMRHAHHAGLRTTATMMYGTVETLEERLEHLFRLRDLQDETGGFTAFITWSYQPEHTELSGVEATGHRLSPHPGDRPPGARQLRQPAVLVGHAGRQGWTVESGVRRQRHGLRHDRGERRAGRRGELLHGRSRDRPQYRGRRLHPQAPQHALRDPRRPVLPGTRRAPHDGTRHRKDRRRGGRAR